MAVQGDGRDRGQALLRARRDRLSRHRACRLDGRDGRQGRRGRLDHHAAARPEPLHRPGAHVQPQGERGLPGDQARAPVVEGEDPERLSEHRLLRQSRVRRRGRGADVLLRARQGSDAVAVGAPRRAAAGAVDLRPVARPASRAAATGRGAAGDAPRQRDHAGGVPPGDPVALAGPEARQRLHAHLAAVLLLVRDRSARAALRREHGPRGRPAGLHDDRPASCSSSQSGRSTTSCR